MSRPAIMRMIEGAIAPAISNVFVNNKCSVCTLQITGTFTSATVVVEGIVDVSSGAWTTLATFNLSDLSMRSDGMEEKSIYQVGIEGILRIRANVTAVSGGNITVVGHFVDATIASNAPLTPANEVPTTAYDIARAGGYTGTYEQFQTDMGNSATNATNAANSASSAETSATNAAAAATNFAPVFATNVAYSAGDYVLKDGVLYKFTANHAAGAWTGSDAVADKLAPEVADLKNALTQITIIRYPVTFTDGYYITTNGNVGTTVNLTPVSNASWRYAIVDCSAGDVFEYKTEGATSARSWAFVDSSNAMLANATSGVHEGTLTAPTNSSKVIFCDKKSTGAYAEKIDGTDKFQTVENEILAVLDKQSDISNDGSLAFAITSDDVTFYRGIAYPSLVVANLSEAQYMSKKYPTYGAEKVKITLKCNDITSAITFYNSDGTAISGVQGKGNTTSEYYETIPANTEYIVISGSVEDYSMPYTGYLYTKIRTELDTIENYIDNGYVAVSNYTVTTKSYVAMSNLEILTGQNSNSYITSEIEIPDSTKKIRATLSALAVESAFTFYDENHDAISGIAGRQANADSAEIYTIDIPASAVYVRVSGWKQVADAPTTIYFLYYSSDEAYNDSVTIKKRTGNNSAEIKYTAFGDSITAGIGSTGNDKSYAYILNGIFGFSAFNNRGVSGTSFVKQNADNGIIYTRTSDLSGYTGIITVMGGTNDYGNSVGSPLGDVDTILGMAYTDLTAPSTTYDAEYTFAEAFRYTIENLIVNNPNAVIYVLSPINRVNEDVVNDQGKTLDDYRECEKKICHALGITYIDMRECGISIFNDNTLLGDGLHPNDNGYKRMAAFLVKTIENMISELNYLA